MGEPDQPGANLVVRRPPDLPPGQRLGSYRIESLLGRGGMGEVYLALDLTLERRVAVKVLSHLDARAVARFLSEARNHARLDHPNVVPVYGAGTEEVEGTTIRYLVLRFVDGRTLFERVAIEGPMDPELVTRMIVECARGLDYVHREGFVHRDVKPGNILLDRCGRALVSDFGIARDTASEGDTREGVDFVGTWDYAAPEQLARRAASSSCDQYSLGLTALFALTGRHPFSSARAEGGCPPMPDFLPSPLREVLARMTAHDPVMRFPSLGALVRALEGDLTDPLTSEGNDLRVGPGRLAWVAAVLGAAILGAAYTGVGQDRDGSPREARAVDVPPAPPAPPAPSETGPWDVIARDRLAEAETALRAWIERAENELEPAALDESFFAELRGVFAALGLLDQEARSEDDRAIRPAEAEESGASTPRRAALRRALNALVVELGPPVARILDRFEVESPGGTWHIDRQPLTLLQYFAFLTEVTTDLNAPLPDALSPAEDRDAQVWMRLGGPRSLPRPRLDHALQPVVGLHRAAIERFAASRGKRLPDKDVWEEEVAPMLREWHRGDTTSLVWETVLWEGELFLGYLVGEPDGAPRFTPRERSKREKTGVRLVREISSSPPD